MISKSKGGDEASRAKDVLGRVCEYFLPQFASAEGKKGGEYYTPRCAVKLLVEMLGPYRGRVYDPCYESSRGNRAGPTNGQYRLALMLQLSGTASLGAR